MTFGGDVVDPGGDHSVVKTIVQAEGDVADKGRMGSVIVQRRRYACSSVDVSIWIEE